jgi:hypothetical protein
VMIFIELRVTNFVSHIKRILSRFLRRWIFRVPYGELLQILRKRLALSRRLRVLHGS